jgi:outer membrane protein TolC
MKQTKSRSTYHPLRPVIAAMMGLALATCTVGASAQISLGSALDLALKNSPKMKMSKAAVTKAEAALNQTYDAYIPTATAEGVYGKGIGVPTGLPTIFTLSSQSLVFNFSQRDNIRAAASGVRSAKLALKDMQNQIEEDVVITYLNLNNDQQREAAITQEHQYATRLVSIVQDRLDEGQDTRISLLQAKRAAKQIELNQIHLQDEIATLSDHLARIIGLPGNVLTAVPSSIPPLPSPSSIAAGGNDRESFGVLSALEGARSKQELSFGANRYRLRPQISLGIDYSRIDTGQNDYTQYYPDFKGKSENAESIFFSIQIPLFDRKHEDQAKEATAEALRARFEAESQRNDFLEGRFKLQHSTAELETRSELAQIDRDLAQEQLNAILVQLSADSSSVAGPQMTPKDEQNARLAERQRAVDLLDAQFQLNQAQVNLLRQTGQLDTWCKSTETFVSAPTTQTPIP